MPELLRFNKELKYIVFDTETEGLNLAASRPWEISWVVVEGGSVVKKYEKFPYIHDLKLSAGAAAVTRFNYDDYKKKSEPAIDVYNELEKYIYNEEYLIVGQNILGFDVYQLSNFQKYLGKKVDYSYIRRIYDTTPIGRAYQTQTPFTSDKADVTPWMYRMLSFRKKNVKSRLPDLCKAFGVEYNADQHHGGLYDSVITSQIFQKMIWNMEII